VGQFADAQKTSIINGFPFIGLCGSNCEVEGSTVLDTLHSLLRVMLCHQISPQVMARKPLMLLLRVSMFVSKYGRTLVLH
jgi:hypothetical protein